jgi:hypothetical protein
MDGGAFRQSIGSATHHLYTESSSHISDRIRGLQDSFKGVSQIRHDLFAEGEWFPGHCFHINGLLILFFHAQTSRFERFLLPIWQDLPRENT